MSTEVFYKVRVRRDTARPTIVQALVLGCSSNCFPKPSRLEEPTDDLFTVDLAEPGGLPSIVDRVTSLARSADGHCIKDGGRYYEGPAYYRLWQKRLKAVGVILPEPDLAAVRYERIASPEKPKVRVSFRKYQLQIVEFSGSFRFTVVGEAVKQIVLLDFDEQSRQIVHLEYFGEGGTFIRRGWMAWKDFRRLMKSHCHVLRRHLPAVLECPCVIRVWATGFEPVSLPRSETGGDERVGLMQRIVGGLVQVVYGEDDREFYVNEEGGIIGLPRNELATREARAAGAIRAGDWIKGNCVIIPPAPSAQTQPDVS